MKLIVGLVLGLVVSASPYLACGASLIGLGDLPGGGFYSVAYGVSDDGRIVVGAGTAGGGAGGAFRWTAQTGMIGLGSLPGAADSTAFEISGDGSTIVGTSQIQAFRWTLGDGMVGLGSIPGVYNSWTAYGVSGDGRTIVGYGKSLPNTETNAAFLWKESSGLIPLGDLPGGVFYSVAEGVSGDGSVIVGASNSENGYEPFRWTQATGMVALGVLPGDPANSGAQAVSRDGSTTVVSVPGTTHCQPVQKLWICDATHTRRLDAVFDATPNQ